MYKRIIKGILPVMLSAILLVGCGSSASASGADTTSSGAGDTSAAETSASTQSGEVVTNLPQIDNTKWQYNSDDNVYYQIGISYCETPADESYETLSIFVPGDYMNATDNGDGIYTCEINTEATVGSYTAETAPMVLPVNTPGYAAQDALTEYQSFSDYTDQGIIYVHAGCRGRDAGAPAGVTDLKAAIRYIRYSADTIPGDTERIFSFGMSGGGAQSALLGVTGDSEMYDDYLNAIGAVQGVSDAVLGSMDWCPITSLDSADAAYEWNMGNTRTCLSDEEQEISDELTSSYAEYINSIGLTDEDGNALTLEASDDGRYQSGTYYEYIKEQIETSLNNFLSDTTFPYDSDSSSQGHQAGMGGQGGAPDGEMPSGDAPDGEKMGADAQGGAADTTADAADSTDVDYTAIDDIARTETSSGITISGTFETAQDYIDALNADGEWVTYDATTNTATISSIADFTAAVKNSSKGIAAFDQLDASQGENTLFGYNDGNGAHFDDTLYSILKDIGSDYTSDFEEDLAKTDSVGHDVEYRVNMYSPLYFLLESQEGYGTSTVAKYFLIRTGAWQSDTSITTEINLALALENYSEDTNVDFATVWGQEHTTAERSGDSTTNFIEWVNECCAAE